MIPAGYMYKKIAMRPDYIKNPNVIDIYSLSGCISKDFSDYINHWKHNGYWLFDNPSLMKGILSKENIAETEFELFYYEVFEKEFDEDQSCWSMFTPEPSFLTNVTIPSQTEFQGYDLVTFTNGPECSPLSCNSMADEITTNSHCLMDDFDCLKEMLESEKFKGCEPGPYRIFSVYSVPLVPKVSYK
jgi:hypothetical protein